MIEGDRHGDEDDDDDDAAEKSSATKAVKAADEEAAPASTSSVARSAASLDGSAGHWSASVSTNSRHAERSLSPFEDDAIEKALHGRKCHQHARRNSRGRRGRGSDKRGKESRLIRVLEDLLLLRQKTSTPLKAEKTQDLKTQQQPPTLDINGRKQLGLGVVLEDPLASLFETTVEELATATGSTSTTVKTKARKRKAHGNSSLEPIRKRGRPSKAKKKLLVNGKTLNNVDAKTKNHSAFAGSAHVHDKPATKTASRPNKKIAALAAKQTKKLKVTSIKKTNGVKKRTRTNKSKTKLLMKTDMDFVKENKLELNPVCTESVVKKTFTDTLKRVQEAKKREVEMATNTPNSRPSSATIKQFCPMVTSIRKEFGNKNEKVCQKCEKVDENLVRCEGICHGMFHAACISDDQREPMEQDQEPEQQPRQESSPSLKCDECVTGRHSCFVCKSKDEGGGEVRQCSARACGKFYHVACLTSFRAASFDPKGTFTCPLHFCLACILSNDKKTAKNGSRMFRCVRCPVAYHGNEACFAAGSVVLTSQALLCPAHHKGKKRRNAQVNVNFCFVCSHGGSLICCETCPASFHAECLNMETPDGSYYCAECLSKSQPKYGDIVWVKLGNYRWWPAKVCNPRNVPPNIKSVHHEQGDFPVRFFGTNDYHWTRRSRTFQFLEGDHVAHTGTLNKLGKIFKTALEEALAAFQKWKCAKETREAQKSEKNNLKPPQYKYLKANRPVGSVSAVTIADPLQMTSCDCNPRSENPCGPNSECLNRLLLLECSPSTCPAGELCQNQQFMKQEYVKAEIFRTDGKGWGLKSLENIFKGQFVNEYVGEMIDENECKRRMKKMQEENDTAYYFLTLDKDRIIDAGKKGNLSRFMNHSCQPNCELRKWTVNGDTRVGLFALCDIATGTELTFNYNLECLGNEKTKCQCEAPNCSGFIGERPKILASSTTSKRANKTTPKSRRRKSRVCSKANYDSECYRCGQAGELLLCDRKNCTKAFHLSCLSLEKTPHGRWECPWHHCDTCGKQATVLCSACPNSYCADHVSNNVTNSPDGSVVCMEHEAVERLLSSTTSTEVPAENTADSENNLLESKDQAGVQEQEDSIERNLELSEPKVLVVPESTKQMEKTPICKKTVRRCVKRVNGRVKENGRIAVNTNGRLQSRTDGSTNSKVVLKISLVAKNSLKQMSSSEVAVPSSPRNGDLLSLSTTDLTVVIDDEKERAVT